MRAEGVDDVGQLLQQGPLLGHEGAAVAPERAPLARRARPGRGGSPGTGPPMRPGRRGASTADPGAAPRPRATSPATVSASPTHGQGEQPVEPSMLSGVHAAPTSTRPATRSGRRSASSTAHAARPAVGDDGGRARPPRVEQSGHERGVPGHAGGLPGVGSVARAVGGEHPEPVGQPVGHRVPRRARPRLAVQQDHGRPAPPVDRRVAAPLTRGSSPRSDAWSSAAVRAAARAPPPRGPAPGSSVRRPVSEPASSGRATMNAQPAPGAESTETSPPKDRARLATMNRPRPDPWPRPADVPR